MWQSRPEVLELSRDTVDVWRLGLEQPTRLVEQSREVLTHDERARADRFRFARDHDAYTLTRGALRRLLGAYLGVEPADVAFVEGKYGKPAVAEHPIAFNVTHSHKWALLVFTRGRPVGVDVELIQPRKSLDLVCRHHFTDAERTAVMGATDPTERRLRFYRCWTRKEAYIKATGLGLAMPLDSFEVSVDETARLLWLEDGDADRWELRDLSVADDYVAALCVQRDEALAVRALDASTLPY